jgi:hypothetical protein
MDATLRLDFTRSVLAATSVVFDGKLLVERSRDPECDAARALLKRGYTGKLHMLDGKTGKLRTIMAAKLTAEEGPNGPLFRRFRGMEQATTSQKQSPPLAEAA